MVRKRGERDGWREQEEREATVWREKERRYTVEEIEQREGERRQELAEKAVTRVLLMCNETLHPGRDNRKDGRMEGDRGTRKGEEEEEPGRDGAEREG